MPAGRRIVDPHRDGDRRADAGGRTPLLRATCWRRRSTVSPTICEAHVGPDDLAIDDCGLAAAQFLQMCQATLFLPFVFQAEPAPSAERIARVVDSATRMFLADVSGDSSRGIAAVSRCCCSNNASQEIRGRTPPPRS